MSIIIKPPSWGHCTTNLTGTPSTTVYGTAITAGANDADGAAVSFITSLTHDVEYLVIGINNFGGTANTNTSTLLDILVDPAGGSTWTTVPTLINDLLCGYSVAATGSVAVPVWYHFPVWLKSGHSIGGQARTASGADITTGEVIIYAYGANSNPGSWWCGTSVETIGVDDTISQGQSHTVGSGSYSSWTNLGSTLSKPCGALQFAVQGTNTDTVGGGTAIFFEFGVGSTRIGPNILRTSTSGETGWTSPSGPIFCSLPASTQLQVRALTSGVPEAHDVAAYAVM
jgi:hypothetical protein